MSAVMVSMAFLICTFSSGIHTHPVSWNFAYHLRMELSDGGCFPNLVRNCCWTIVPRQSFWITLYFNIMLPSSGQVSLSGLFPWNQNLILIHHLFRYVLQITLTCSPLIFSPSCYTAKKPKSAKRLIKYIGSLRKVQTIHREKDNSD